MAKPINTRPQLFLPPLFSLLPIAPQKLFGDGGDAIPTPIGVRYDVLAQPLL
jgi:hypothetical protein